MTPRLKTTFQPSTTYLALEANCNQVASFFTRDLLRRKKFKAIRMDAADDTLSNVRRPGIREFPQTRLEIPLGTGQFHWGRPDGWAAKDLLNPPFKDFPDPHPPVVSKTAWNKADGKGKSALKRPASTPALPLASQTWYGGQTAKSSKPRKSEYSTHIEPFEDDQKVGHVSIDRGEVDRIKRLMTIMGSRYKLMRERPAPKMDLKVTLGPREWLDPLVLWEKSDGSAPQQWLSYRKAQAKDEALFRATF